MEKEEIISDTFFYELTKLDKTKLIRVYTKNGLNYNSCKLKHVGNDYISIRNYSGDLVYIKISEISNLRIEKSNEESSQGSSESNKIDDWKVFKAVVLIVIYGCILFTLYKL